ncbi:MAG TPA: SDR family NAD(P)-dependent oxidoreductase [Deltaproteobacteria bacterium]|nr:SDR family NAD(P)-dependent oxidoreductase [Deltaproteobacteria bacterium]
MPRKNLRDQVAVVTGAASGIGRALALGLAEEGCRLALVDVDAEGLASIAETLRAKKTEVLTQVADVSNADQVFEMAQRVLDHHGEADLVINNAGVVHFGTIAETDLATYEWLLGINLWGVIHGTKAFLPHFLEKGRGHVVNISSLAGLLTVPYGSAYATSKFGVRAFTETLYQEVSGRGVDVTCVHPSVVSTNIARAARIGDDLPIDRAQLIETADRQTFTTAEKAAAKIIRAIRRRQLRLVIGPDARLMVLLQRLLPIQSIRLAARFVFPIEKESD